MTTYGTKTLLRRICPRCGRSGTVYWDKENQTCPFDIVWDGPPRNPYDGARDEDWNVTLSELLNDNFGCGYDDPKEIEATERLKVVPLAPEMGEA